MQAFDEVEIDRRASVVSGQYAGIFSPNEAFYIHSICYSADRASGAFERFDIAMALRDSDENRVSAVHEALGHAAGLSRFFWPSGLGAKASKAQRALREARAAKLRDAFSLTDASPLKNRRLRDSLEHFDEKLDVYLLQHDAGAFFPTALIGSVALASDPTGHIFKLVDPQTSTFVIFGDAYEFGPLRAEVERVRGLAVEMGSNGSRLPQPAG